jgi:hypothetical protein
MLFVVVMVALMTIGVLASVQLTTSAAALQSKREAEARAKLAFEGAVQFCLTEYRAKTVTIPATRAYSVGDQTVSLTVADNAGAIPRTLRFDGETKVQGRRLTFTRTTGNALDPHPFYYALFSNATLDPMRPMTFGAAGTRGDVNLNGGVMTRANPFVVHGDYESTTAASPIGSSVSGNRLLQARTVQFPGVNAGDYNPGLIGGLLNALTLILGNLVGRVFPTVEPFQLLYRGGNLSLSGEFSGKGTVFVAGDVTISGNMTYANADSRLVVIATGRITIGAGVTNYVGFYYTPTEFVSSATATTLTSGSIAAQKLTVNGPMTIVHDPSFWDQPELGVKHRIPGLWP